MMFGANCYGGAEAKGDSYFAMNHLWCHLFNSRTCSESQQREREEDRGHQERLISNMSVSFSFFTILPQHDCGTDIINDFIDGDSALSVFCKQQLNLTEKTQQQMYAFECSKCPINIWLLY